MAYWLIAGLIALGAYRMFMKTPRGLRNNNPGNIRVGNDWWNGQVGDDGAFVQFESVEYGIRAMGRIMDSYARRGLVTVEDIITTWAPPTENDTAAYLEHVRQLTGLAPRDVVMTVGARAELVKAIIHHENGFQPFSDDLIRESLLMA